jgi:hypothetical protein
MKTSSKYDAQGKVIPNKVTPLSSDAAPPLEITQCFRTPDRVRKTFELFEEADVIILQGKDTGISSLAFGKSALDKIIATGEAKSLVILRVNIRFNTTDELEIALAAVQHVKGHHEYEGCDDKDQQEIRQLEELFRLDPGNIRLRGIGFEGNQTKGKNEVH